MGHSGAPVAERTRADWPTAVGADPTGAPPTTLASAAHRGRRGVLALITVGIGLAGLLAALVVLYANVPDGYDSTYGLSLDSPDLFRGLWPYPRLGVQPVAFGCLSMLLMLALWGLYLAAWLLVRRQVPTARARLVGVIVAFTVLYHGALAAGMSPVLSTDVYHYALFGRIVAIYDLNPYVTPGAAIPDDPLWSFVGWRHREVTSHYGPVWTLISAFVAALGSQSVLLTALLFKGVATLFSLANCLLVFLLARRLTGGDGVGALLLYAWNPLILIETAGSGHNDAAMMTFALLGLLLAARGWLVLGLAALLLSVMVKYLTALLAFFFVIRCLLGEPSARRRTVLAARMAAVAGPLVALLYLPFWAGPATLERLITVGSPFQAPVRSLLREIVAMLLTRWAGIDDARAWAQLFVIIGLHLGFVLLLALLVKKAWAERPGWSRVLELWAISSLVYIGLVYGWNLPWFLVSALTTTCIALRTRTDLRLLALSHALGLVWMLPYGTLVAL